MSSARGSAVSCGSDLMPHSGETMSTVTVLAIDGGGIRGMIPAAFLNKLEHNDLVAGVSKCP
jgi:hypothetical protein